MLDSPRLKLRLLIALSLLAFLLVACEEPAPSSTGIQAYFTNPASSSQNQALQDALLDSLNNARTSVDIAMYNFNLLEAGNALRKARSNGAAVRIVVDSDAMDNKLLQQLRREGFEVLGDRREGLMHNKFIVIDGKTVWTGSLNLTYGGLTNDENNLVRIESPDLAERYTEEFNEMFEEDLFGGGTPLGERSALTLNGNRAWLYFSPEDVPSQAILERIQQTQTSINMLAYAFTLNDLRDALLESAHRGLDVRIVFDAGQSTATGSEYQTLKNAGLDVRLDGSSGLMHHKVIILDGKTVIFGSYNFTRSADVNNDENVLIVENAELAKQFTRTFERIYTQAQP
ncbi:phosphatidylserine/phosphatidylglycerophosphate/cardiolipin synthase family protein [Anaerolinea thermophila]|uniref:phospholipase D-like domain-containing protein n=2 Tax=Anaerolinea TaxID=233189 RepID=UPI0026E9A4E7|nr:phospholipase D-like domain-containing protein [Anaerolinea thermophila]